MVATAPTTIRLAMGPIKCMVLCLSSMDTRWEGVLEGRGKCVWLKDGRRVEFFSSGGSVGGSLGREPDPAYPGKRRINEDQG